MEINSRIIKMRNVWRLSEEQVAKSLGIDINEYKKLEQGISEPDMKTAMKLCEIFQITLDYLMTGVESDKDLKAINRPLTREERISDQLEELKKEFPKQIFDKYYDYIYAIYIDRDRMQSLFDRQTGLLLFDQVLNINSYDLLKDLAEKGKFDLHYVQGRMTSEHKYSTCIDDVLAYEVILKFIQNNSEPDKKFVDYAIKKDPVKTLNYYFLSKQDDLDKEGILKCIAAGGYIQKVVEISYYYDDEYGSSRQSFKFGRDNFATMLLKHYCESK